MTISEKDPVYGPVPHMNQRQIKACIYFLLKSFKGSEIDLYKFFIPNPDGKGILSLRADKDLIADGVLNKGIIHMIDNLKMKQEDKADLFKRMLKIRDSFILSEGLFSWLKENDRACYWLWLSLSSNRLLLSVNIVTPSTLKYFEKIRHTLHQMRGDYFPDSKRRFEIILECFDSVFMPVEKKEELLKELKISWDEFVTRQGELKWVDRSDIEKCEWLWAFIKSHESTRKFVADNFSSSYMDSECYLSFIATYDAWPTIPEAKKLFLINAQRAWNQKKYRDKQQKEKRKAMNIHISDDAKKMLKTMSMDRGMKMNEMIEQLILNEFNTSTSR